MTTNPYAKKSDDDSGTESVNDMSVKAVPAKAVSAKNSEAEHKAPEKNKPPRQITFKRKLGFAILKPVFLLIVNVVWISCRVKVIGQQNMDSAIESNKPVIPCYWHQQHLFCGWYMLQQIKRGMKVGFLISPSVDGEIPAKVVSSRGAKVIRGSSTRTGAQALRDMYLLIAKEGISPVTTSDGPTGPIYKFKPGAVMLSQMTKAPMLPIAYAAKSAWYLGSWDRFMIPKPFTRITIAIGEPVSVTAEHAKDTLPVQQEMEQSINQLMLDAKQAL